MASLASSMCELSPLAFPSPWPRFSTVRGCLLAPSAPWPRFSSIQGRPLASLAPSPGLASLPSEVAHRPHLPPCLILPLSEVALWPFLPPGLASLLCAACPLASCPCSRFFYVRCCPVVSTAPDLNSPFSKLPLLRPPGLVLSLCEVSPLASSFPWPPS